MNVFNNELSREFLTNADVRDFNFNNLMFLIMATYSMIGWVATPKISQPIYMRKTKRRMIGRH